MDENKQLEFLNILTKLNIISREQFEQFNNIQELRLHIIQEEMNGTAGKQGIDELCSRQNPDKIPGLLYPFYIPPADNELKQFLMGKVLNAYTEIDFFQNNNLSKYQFELLLFYLSDLCIELERKETKEIIRGWKDEILTLEKIYRESIAYLRWSKQTIGKEDVRVVLPPDLSNYHFRFLLAHLPLWLCEIGEIEKSEQLLIYAFDEMDAGCVNKEWFEDLVEKCILNCKELDRFTSLQSIYLQIMNCNQKEMEDGFQRISALFCNLLDYFERKAQSDKNNLLGFEARYQLLKEGHPYGLTERCMENTEDEMVVEWLEKTECRTLPELQNAIRKKQYIGDKSIYTDITVWLSFFCENPGVQLPSELLYKGQFTIPPKYYKDICLIKSYFLPVIQKSFCKEESDITIALKMMEFEKHRDILFKEKLSDSTRKISDIKEAYKDKDGSEEELDCINNVLDRLNGFLIQYSDSALKQVVQKEIKDRMREYCSKFLKEDNKDLFANICDKHVKTDVYRQIFSGLIYFKKLEKMNDDGNRPIDYSGVILQMTRALEVLLKYIYGYLFEATLEETINKHFNNEIPDDETEVPESAEKSSSKITNAYYYFNHSGEKKSEVSLGELSYLFKKQQKKKCGLLQNDNSTLMVEYGEKIIDFDKIKIILEDNQVTSGNNSILANLKKTKDADAVTISDNIWDKLFDLTDKYRNPSAHGTDIMQIESAVKCREILMETECLLWILMMILKNPKKS